MSSRKRKWTKREALEVIKKHQKNMQLAAEEICDELLPADFHDEETSAEVEKFDRTLSSLRVSLGKLSAQDKVRKFRNNEAMLEETFVNSSQYSIFQSSQGSTQARCSSLEDFDSQELLDSLPQSTQKEYKKRPLNDPSLSAESRRRRVKSYRDIFTEWCKENGCSIAELAGLFIHLDNYISDRDLAKLGWNLFTSNIDFSQPKATCLEAIWVLEKLGISYSKYTDLRLKFLDRLILPPAAMVAEKSKQMKPGLETYQHGVRANLADCLTITLAERLATVNTSHLANKVLFSFNYGMDGSGQHSDYSQQSKANFSTKQIINVCFALIKITKPDGTIIWSASDKGHNSPQNIRPLALFPSKESDEMLRGFIPTLEEEIKSIKTTGLQVKLENGEIIQAKIEKEAMSMCDGKMIVRLLQLGGSYCTMCHFGQDECHDESVIRGGFKITRTVESITELAKTLFDPETEEIKKTPGDYQRRQGITGLPITGAELTTVLPVCHAKIHAFDWMINRLLVKANSHKKWHSLSKPVRYSEEEKDSEKNARESLKMDLKQLIGINICDPSEMTTGNQFKTFCSDNARSLIAGLLNDSSLQDSFKEIHLGLCAIIRVLNSQHRTINLLEYRSLCSSIYLKIVETFPWAVISPSIHRVLAHSWERIEANELKGLGSESEEGSEAQNKLIRYLRIHGARKTSTEDNFHDTWSRLWRRSSPLVINQDREKRKQTAKIVVLTEIDALVESLFSEN